MKNDIKAQLYSQLYYTVWRCQPRSQDFFPCFEFVEKSPGNQVVAVSEESKEDRAREARGKEQGGEIGKESG